MATVLHNLCVEIFSKNNSKHFNVASLGGKLLYGLRDKLDVDALKRVIRHVQLSQIWSKTGKSLWEVFQLVLSQIQLVQRRIYKKV